MYGLLAGARSIGLRAAGLSGTIKDLQDSISAGEVMLPMVAPTRSNNMLHFVVVTQFESGVVRWADPARGRRKVSVDEFSQVWTGHVAAFEKVAPILPSRNRVRGFPFASLLRGEYSWLVGILALSFVVALFGTLGAFSFQLVIDSISGDSDNAEGVGSGSLPDLLASSVDRLSTSVGIGIVALVFMSLIGLYALQAGIQYLRGYLIILVSKRIDAKLFVAYFNHLVSLPVASIHLRKTGEYMSRLTDAAAIRAAISGVAVSLVLDSVMAVGTGVILYMQGESLFWVSLTMVGIYSLLLIIYRRPMAARARLAMEKDSIHQSYFKEAVDGIETVKAAGADPQVKSQSQRKLSEVVEANAKEGLLAVSQDAVSEAVQLIGTAVILWWGFSMVLSGDLSLGSLITFYALLGMFVQPVRNLVELQPVVQAAFVAGSRMNDVFVLNRESMSSGHPISPAVGVWAFDCVTFCYGNGEKALSGVTLEIGRSQRIGIVGTSGSGKTTLARLLMRFYEPASGSLKIDGLPISRLSLSDLRESIAYVDQNTFMFADSIENNLTLGRPGLLESEIRAACETAQAAEFIDRLPLHYETSLDEGGANLSNGQRQRLAIARALLKSPQLLILDEATSNLDPSTEARFWRSLSELKDLTVMIVAHRLAAVRDCDRIYVLEKGEIVESGSHDELLDQQGAYASLWASQDSLR